MAHQGSSPGRRARRPSIEALEGRYLLDAGIGIGISGNAPYSADGAWVDVRNLFGPWGSYSNPSQPATGLPLTADGYPLSNASTATPLFGYSGGTYTLTYTGTATLTFAGIGQLSSPVTTEPDGVSTATVLVTPAPNSQLIMQVSNIDPNNPLDNLHLIAPGYDPTNPPIFTTQFLQRLQPFADLRFMPWMEANVTTIQSWSERTTPNDFLQTGPAGVAYEYIVDLANTLHKNIWINIPDQASSDYGKQLADFLLANLDPGINIYLEYSNELWNPGFPQFQRNLTAAEANPLLTATGETQRAGQEAAYKLFQFTQIFQQEFGSQASRVLPVLGGQAVDTTFLKAGLAFINTTYGPPSHYFDAIAIAPYVRVDPSVDVPGMTMDQLFASMNSYLNGTLANGIAANAAVAQQYGLQMVAYEGGQSLVAWNPVLKQDENYDTKLAAQDDPQMSQLYRSLAALWQQDGGGLFNYSTLTFDPAPSGFWGLLPSEQAAGSVKWGTVMSLLGALPDPGDYDGGGQADLAVFRPSTDQWFIAEPSVGVAYSFGGPGDIPLQGDFNGDGKNDVALYRPSTNQWFMILPNGSGQAFTFGGPGDLAVPADFESDGQTDPAVYRPSTGQWFIAEPSGGVVYLFGGPGDVPVPADYDGVGHAEPAVYRPSTGQWFILGPNGGRVVAFGGPGDVPVPGDYDGLGYDELAMYRPSTGQYFILGPNGGRIVTLGAPGGSIPVPLDYNGNGQVEPAAFDPATATWLISTPTGVNTLTFGAANLDIPVSAAYLSQFPSAFTLPLLTSGVSASSIQAAALTVASPAAGSASAPSVALSAATATATPDSPPPASQPGFGQSRRWAITQRSNPPFDDSQVPRSRPPQDATLAAALSSLGRFSRSGRFGLAP
jgi:hypothetical protein